MRLYASKYIGNMLAFGFDVEIQAVEMLANKLPNASVEIDGDLEIVFVRFD